MSTGDTVLFWVICGILGYGVTLGIVNFYHSWKIWQCIRRRRLRAKEDRR